MLSLFPEVVQAQGGGLAGALLLPDGGGDKDNGGDEEGQGLVQLGRNGVKPAQRSREGAGQGTGINLERIEEAKNQGAQNGHYRVPVGEDD